MPQTGSIIEDDFYIVKTHQAEIEHVDRQSRHMEHLAFMLKWAGLGVYNLQTKPIILGTDFHIALTAIKLHVLK